MTELNEESLTKSVFEIMEYGMKISLKPTQLLFKYSLLKDVLRHLYYKPPIKKVNGMRKRKKAFYWRGR